MCDKYIFIISMCKSLDKFSFGEKETHYKTVVCKDFNEAYSLAKEFENKEGLSTESISQENKVDAFIWKRKI